MNRSTQEKTIRRRLEVVEYDGSNEIINGMLEKSPLPKGQKLWRVNGSWGLVPITARNKTEAMDRYVERFAKDIEREEEEKFE